LKAAKTHILYALTAILLTISLTACDNALLFEENLKIAHSEWHRNEKAKFQFRVEDTTATYDLYLNIRHGGEYPYKNLYLFTETRSPNGLIAIDTAQMIFADNSGRWMGKGIGGIYDYQFKFKEKIEFPVSGEYIVEIEQGMRAMVVPELTDIGIRIEKNLE
jgi:gliding motility-associated lipoprotein GldH